MVMDMKKYIGVKVVEACEMTAEEAGHFLNKPIDTSNADAEGNGYLVQYRDNYRSWCPKKQFEDANRLCDGLTFGHAIEAAKDGKRIARKGWNGKGMYVYLVRGTMVDRENLRNEAYDHAQTDHTDVATFLSHLDMITNDGSICVGWLASQTDILADDWQVVQ